MAKCFSLALIALFLVMLNAAEAGAVVVSGLPAWLSGAVRRSVNAVWEEIPDTPETDREGTLEVVASRLFAGYEVRVKPLHNSTAVIFLASEDKIPLTVKVTPPDLRGITASWFSDDIRGLDAEAEELLSEVPQSALTWADEAFREEMSHRIAARLPGWDFTQQIYISPSETAVTLTFRPSPRMVLAVKPSLSSRTIPAMLRSDLEAKLVPFFSPLIGLPVKWAAKHSAEIERAAIAFLEDRHSVENLRAEVSVKFSADTVSMLDAAAESEDFMFSMWVAAYAGIEGRYPEAGVYFGFRPAKYLEVYAELVFELNEFDITRRLGLMFEPFRRFFAGIELQWPENEYFIRAQYIPQRFKRPYVMWRWSPELQEHEGVIGYRLDEHLSIELYYYHSGGDKVGLRGMWHL